MPNQTPKLIRDEMTAIERALGKGLRKIEKQASAEAQRLVPVGTPVQYTRYDEETGEVHTIQSKVEAPVYYHMDQWVQPILWIPIDGKKYDADTVVLLPKTTEEQGELFDED